MVFAPSRSFLILVPEYCLMPNFFSHCVYASLDRYSEQNLAVKDDLR